MDKFLRKLGLIRISTIEKLLKETRANHITNNKEFNNEYNKEEFYFDCGADSVINHVLYVLGKYPTNKNLR